MQAEPTIEKLKALRLDAMAEAWSEQKKNVEAARLGFDERFGLLVDVECVARENRRLKKVLKDAKLKISHASIEDIDYPVKRELDKAVIRQLATCRWVTEHQNVCITGATGAGKTFIACALAQHACRRGFRAIYRRTSRLFDELRIARADGTYVRVLAKLARADVIVLDDFALTSVGDDERRDLSEILEDRQGSGSTIVATQLPPNKWHEYLGEPTVADAICDRLLPNAHRIVLKGPSRRDPKEKSK